MTAATALRATALPMPTVAVTPARRTVGRSDYGQRVLTVGFIGSTSVLLGTEKVFVECGRCTNGTGTLSCFGHVYGGVCFECNGAGVRVYGATVEAAQRKVRSAQAAALRAQAAADQAAADYAAALPGIIAAAYVAALAEDDQRNAAAAAQAAAEAAQSFAGVEGDKITFTGTVTVTFACESVYGTRYMVIVEGTGANAGQTVKTVGTSAFHFEAERGDVVTVKATVKGQEVYKGTKQTVVIRPKAV